MDVFNWSHRVEEIIMVQEQSIFEPVHVSVDAVLVLDYLAVVVEPVASDVIPSLHLHKASVNCFFEEWINLSCILRKGGVDIQFD